MAAQKEVYRCNHRGMIVEVLHGAGGRLACCGGQTPEAQFESRASAVTAREYCNLHGFWNA